MAALIRSNRYLKVLQGMDRWENGFIHNRVWWTVKGNFAAEQGEKRMLNFSTPFLHWNDPNYTSVHGR